MARAEDRKKTVQTRSAVVQSPGIGPWGRLSDRVRSSWKWVLEQRWLWLLLLVALGTWFISPTARRGSLEGVEVAANTVASRDYVAPTDLTLEDPVTTAEKRRKAQEDVLPVYDFDRGAAQRLEGHIATLFSEGVRLTAGGSEAPVGQADEADGPLTGAELRAALEAANELELSPEILALLIAKGFSPELEDRVRGAVGEVLRAGVVNDKALLLENLMRGVTLVDLGGGTERHSRDLYDHMDYPEEVLEHFISEVRRWPGFGSRERATMVNFLLSAVSANLSPNTAEVVRRRAAAVEAADRVYVKIRRGEVIVRKGDRIDAAGALKIRELAAASGQGSRLLPLLGCALLMLLVALVLWAGPSREKPGEQMGQRTRERRFCEASLILMLGLGGTWLSLQVARGLSQVAGAEPFNSFDSYLYAVPFGALALVARLITGRNTALVLSVLFTPLAGLMVPERPIPVVIFCLGGSLAALFSLDLLHFKQRLVMTRAGSLVGLANAVLVLILVALATGAATTGPLAAGGLLPWPRLAFDLLCALVGGLVVGAVASFAVPILESTLSVTTDIKLLELSNTNLPVLRRLAFEAPGTFQHSLMVANLAKEGAEAIGSDPILAYAAGLYHDIGKVRRPDYFIENQHGGPNPHDKILPSMSALVLINHVKDGLELARRYHLPSRLIDAIAQHHGTRLIGFFYEREKKREKKGCASGEGEEGRVSEEDFRYPGPRPKDKVMGVLMLADGIEAASRTLQSADEVKIRNLIAKIVDDCLRDGQLEETDLTLSDISEVSKAFQRVLSNIYHRRIDYPGFDFNRPQKGQRSLAAADTLAASSQEPSAAPVPGSAEGESATEAPTESAADAESGGGPRALPQAAARAS